MATATTLRLSAKEYRWSLACRCPRMATLARRQVPATEATQRQRMLRRRGHLFEDLVYQQFADQYGDENILRQREVIWPGGVCHPDLYVIPERSSIEVKSSTHPASLLPDARLQNAGQQLFDPDSDSGALVFIDPVDLDPRVEPVNADEHRAEIDHILEQLAWAESTGGLPDCTAKSPAHCRHGKFCGYTDLAWEGWTPPRPTEFPYEDAARLVADLYRLRQDRRQHDAAARASKTAEKELVAQLAELGLAEGVEYEVGPLRLKYVTVAGGPVAYDRKPYDKWSVERTGDGDLPAEDFGDEAPF